MRKLTHPQRTAVSAVIAAHQDQLSSLPGFVAAEPGFPIVEGRVLREPAVIVFVRHKLAADRLLAGDRAPRQLGAYRVAVMQASPERQLLHAEGFDDQRSEMTFAESQLTYEPIEDNPIDVELEVSGPILCHVSPDAGWPVLKPFLEATQHTLTVAMYDFNADYIAKTLLDTVQDASLDFRLAWDDSMTAAETKIRQQIRQLGPSEDRLIVQCGAGRRFASAYHPKIAVRDSAVVWLSSGNWSVRSQPDIDPIANPAQAKGRFSKGNREWQVIVEDAGLAALLEQYVLHDIAGSRAELAEGDPGAALDVTAQVHLPDVLIPWETFVDGMALSMETREPIAPEALPTHGQPVRVQALMTPDNYIPHLLDLIESAQHSLYLQYSYITYSDREKDAAFREMLERLAERSWETGFDLRIIVGNNDAADKIRRLAEEGFNDAVFRIQTSVHNKGIIADNERVLVSSMNWSGDGVLRNRDAGLIFHDAEVAQYFQRAFVDDWESRARAFIEDDPPVELAAPGTATPPGMVRIAWRDYHG